MSQPPLILLLDMDGTLIGDTTLQVCRNEIGRLIKRKCRTLDDELSSGILRPHFESFVKTIKTRYQNIEIYIYTAADRQWANVMINCIECCLGMKFNRPLFCREHCIIENGTVIKSTSRILPIIYKKLKGKYNLKVQDALYKQVVLIDNSYVIISNERHKFIKCPSYEYFSPCDVISGLSDLDIDSHIGGITSILSKYKLISGEQTEAWKVKSQYYNTLSQLYKSASQSGNKNKKDADMFWLIMERIFRNYSFKSFNSKVVTYINTKLNEGGYRA